MKKFISFVLAITMLVQPTTIFAIENSSNSEVVMDGGITSSNTDVDYNQTQQISTTSELVTTQTTNVATPLTTTVNYTMGTPMPEAKWGSAYIQLGQYLYVIGGRASTGFTSSNLRYDMKNNTWATMAPLPRNVGYLRGATDGRYIYVVGGSIAELWVYDTVTNIWSTRTYPHNSHLTEVQYYYNTLEGVGYLYFFGGDGDFPDHALSKMCYKYNLNTQVYTRIADMPIGGDDRASVIHNGKVYITGGATNIPRTYINNIQIYDIPTNTWSQGTPMSTTQFFHTAFLNNGNIFSVGGAGTQIYNIKHNVWVQGTIPSPAYFPSAGFYNSKAFIIGGGANTGSFYDTVYICDLPNTDFDVTINSNVSGVTYTLSGDSTATGVINSGDKLNLPMGLYNVTLSKVGYQSVSTGNFLLTESTSKTVNLSLLNYNITGKLVDQWSKPVGGVTVTYNGVSTTTNASGIYTLTTTYQPTAKSITFSKTGYGPLSASTVLTGNTDLGSKTLTKQFFTVSGVVKDVKGNVIKNALIQINGSSITTDQDGKYSIDIYQ